MSRLKTLIHFFTVLVPLTSVLVVRQSSAAEKTETFDSDPGWDGHNNRTQIPPSVQITQDFGYSASTSRAGGPAGEIGGLITPAGEPAYYAKVLPNFSFDDPFSVSGNLNVQVGGGHTMVGFFNSNTLNEWRTPNSVAIRLYGRDSFFYGYPEYGTSKWRVGGVSFPGTGDDYRFTTGVTKHTFSLQYDPSGNGGAGLITAAIDGQTAIIPLLPEHRADGASFNRFGIFNVIKSADSAGRYFFDNLVINGQTESFSTNPNWEGVNNRRTYTSNNVRPRFNFGYSSTNKAGGTASGEIGGQIFRGDSRTAFEGLRMAYYGDPLPETLGLQHPLRASGKVAFHRGVSDSTSLIGFFHSTDSVQSSNAQNASSPENFLGVAIEGPSVEGFYFYPSYGLDLEDSSPNVRGNNPPRIYPDGSSHDWTLEYDPAGNNGLGRITISLDGHVATLDLLDGHKQIGARFNRFGIITTHRDGNGQTVYFDDLTYTISIPEPTSLATVALLMLSLFRHRCFHRKAQL
jgi:hypothetical protein